MAKQTLARLKAWFGKGKMPTESQFADLMDSFWHKDEELAVAAVKELAQVLNGKYNESDARILRETVEALQRLAESHGTAIERHGERISELTDAVGAPGGIAPLDESGKVDAQYLPSYVDDVVEFGTFGGYDRLGYADEPPTTDGFPGEYITHSGIAYDTITNKFVDLYSVQRDHWSNWVAVTHWEGMDALGVPTDTGVMPVKGKIYVCEGSRKMYRWCGTCLCEIPTMLELGDGMYQAYRGSKGKDLEAKINTVSADIRTIRNKLTYIPEYNLQPYMANPADPYESLDFALEMLNYAVEQGDLPGVDIGYRITFRYGEDVDNFRWVTYRFWEGPNEEWDPALPECWELVE